MLKQCVPGPNFIYVYVLFLRARMDELRIFLEVEAWEVCPVRSTFTIHKLRVSGRRGGGCRGVSCGSTITVHKLRKWWGHHSQTEGK